MTGAAEPSARERWNERYRRVGAETFGRAPSDWLVQQRPRLEASPAGRALDVACGGGRNALFLAEIGFEVDAVDVSDVAVERLRAVAAQRELSVNAVRADLEDAPFPHSTYQVIINFNVLLRSLFAPIQRALAPGGLLVLETWRQERAAAGTPCALTSCSARSQASRSSPTPNDGKGTSSWDPRTRRATRPRCGQPKGDMQMSRTGFRGDRLVGFLDHERMCGCLGLRSA